MNLKELIDAVGGVLPKCKPGDRIIIDALPTMETGGGLTGGSPHYTMEVNKGKLDHQED